MSHFELARAEFTNDFMSELEVIDIAVGCKMPTTLIKKIQCKESEFVSTSLLTCSLLTQMIVYPPIRHDLHPDVHQ